MDFVREAERLIGELWSPLEAKDCGNPCDGEGHCFCRRRRNTLVAALQQAYEKGSAARASSSSAGSSAPPPAVDRVAARERANEVA